MARRSRRTRDRGAIPLILGGIALGLLGAGAIGSVIVFQLLRQEQPVDEVLCPANSIPTSHTLILVDQTSTFSNAQIETVRAVIENERDNLPERGRLTVVYLNPERPSDPAPIFSRCNPGTGADTDIWLDDPERVHRNWQRQFEAPLDQALSRLVTPTQSDSSPIMETLRGLTWRSDFSRDQPRRRLVVVSDMLENSPLHSMYSLTIADRSFAHLEQQPQFGSIIPELSDVDVEVRLLRSDATVGFQGDEFEAYWREYFSRAHANLRRF